MYYMFSHTDHGDLFWCISDINDFYGMQKILMFFLYVILYCSLSYTKKSLLRGTFHLLSPGREGPLRSGPGTID